MPANALTQTVCCYHIPSFAMDETVSKRVETGPAVLEHLPGDSESSGYFVSNPQQIVVRKISVTILYKNPVLYCYLPCPFDPSS